MNAVRRITRGLLVVVLSLVAVAALYPLVFMALNSLKNPREFGDNPLSLPPRFDLGNYIGLTNHFDVGRLIGNTILYAAISLAACLVISIPASYALAKIRFRGSTLLFTFIVASLGVPTIAILVPDYLLFVQAGFADSPVAVIAMWTGRSLPGTIFLVSAVLRALPDELAEAATIDGAGYLRILWSIVLPLSIPGVVTASIFNVTAWWNDLLVPLVFFQSEEKQTLTAGVATIGQRLATNDVPQTITGLLVASVLPIVLYLFLQGYIRRGLVMGSVK